LTLAEARSTKGLLDRFNKAINLTTPGRKWSTEV